MDSAQMAVLPFDCSILFVYEEIDVVLHVSELFLHFLQHTVNLLVRGFVDTLLHFFPFTRPGLLLVLKVGFIAKV